MSLALKPHVLVSERSTPRLLAHRSLADALAAIDAAPAFQALRHHQGMFSLLPLAPDQMESLRRDHAIYGTATGRINIAGLRSTQIEQVAVALRDVSQA